MSSSHGGRRGTVILLLVVVAATGSSGPCLAESGAADTAMSVLVAAKHYYEKADYTRAAELFHEAYRIDPRPEFLFNAARAEHLGMKLEAAETHYAACLTLKTASAEVRDRARRYVEQVRRTRAAIEAARKAGKGGAAPGAARDKGAASSPVGSATPVARDKGAAASPAGLATPVARDKGAAASPVGSATPVARDKGAAASPVGSATPAASLPAASVAIVTPPSTWRGPAGWAVGGLGAALVVGGGVWFALAYADGAALEEDASGCTVAKPCIGDRDAILAANRDEKVAGLIMGAGVALAGAGAWLLLGTDAERAAWRVKLGPRGVAVAWRFGDRVAAVGGGR